MPEGLSVARNNEISYRVREIIIGLVNALDVLGWGPLSDHLNLWDCSYLYGLRHSLNAGVGCHELRHLGVLRVLDTNRDGICILWHISGEVDLFICLVAAISSVALKSHIPSQFSPALL